METPEHPTIYQVIDRLDALLIAALKAEGMSYEVARHYADELMSHYDWHQRQPIR